MSEIVHALQAHQAGTLPLPGLFRAIAAHPSWHAPAKTAHDGAPTLWLFPNDQGQWWLCAFTDRAAMDAYAQANQVPIGESFLVAKGTSLFRHMPEGITGIGLDLASPHATVLQGPQVEELRELAIAVLVEGVLRSEARRDAWELLRSHSGYRICWQGNTPLLAADDAGRSLAAVFTARDAFDAYRQKVGGSVPEPTVCDGKTLFEQLDQSSIDGIVFNPGEGPVPSRAVNKSFARVALDSQDGQAPAGQAQPQATGQAQPHGASQAAPAAGASAAPSGDPLAMPPTPGDRFGEPITGTVLDPVRVAPTPQSTEAPVVKAAGPKTYVARLVRQDHPSLTPNALKKPLVPPPSPQAPLDSPFFVLAAGSGASLDMLTAQGLGGKSFEEVLGQGISANLGELSLEPSKDVPGVYALLGKGAVEAMGLAQVRGIWHQAMKSDAVVVAVPDREAVLGVSMQMGEAMLTLAKAAKRRFEAAGPDGVYPHPLLMVGGELKGRVSIQLEDEQAPKQAQQARSLAEVGLYLNLNDYPKQGRKESITTEGDTVVVRYDCTRHSDGQKRQFTFHISKRDMAATTTDGPLRYSAGDRPSKLVDAGQFFEMAEALAKAIPARLDGMPQEKALMAMNVIERAAACMDEVILFIPQGQENMPDTAFFTTAGQRVKREQPPGRWSRGRLGAVGGAYRKIADQFRQELHQKGWLYG